MYRDSTVKCGFRCALHSAGACSVELAVNNYGAIGYHHSFLQFLESSWHALQHGRSVARLGDKFQAFICNSVCMYDACENIITLFKFFVIRWNAGEQRKRKRNFRWSKFVTYIENKTSPGRRDPHCHQSAELQFTRGMFHVPVNHLSLVRCYIFFHYMLLQVPAISKTIGTSWQQRYPKCSAHNYYLLKFGYHYGLIVFWSFEKISSFCYS